VYIAGLFSTVWRRGDFFETRLKQLCSQIVKNATG